MMKTYMLLFLFSITTWSAWAQERTVTGTVTDPTINEPIPGATILLKGTTTGTVTDIDGKYKIEVNSGSSILVFSSVGYVTNEVEVGNRSVIDINMETDVQSLEEVVVIGYGSRKVSDLTGSVGTISSDRLDSKPNANIEQALQGAVPGLNITTTGASAEGGQNSILIRGRNSITADNDPLIILDGVPYNGNLSDINPNDINSATVLKDASSTAIYGSRGSNGVIIIETKKGKLGQAKISYAGYYGVQQMVNVPEVYDGPGFAAFKDTRLANDGRNSDDRLGPDELAILSAGEAVDWFDLTTRLGSRQDHNVSVSGATEKASYYTSLGYHKAEGVTLNDQFERISLRVNLNYKITDYIKFGTSTQLSRIDRSGNTPSFSSDRNGLLRFNPLTDAFDEQGNPTIYPREQEDIYIWNPLYPTLEVNDDFNNKVFTNTYIEVDFPFLEGLSYKLNTGVEFDQRTQSTYSGRDTGPGFERGGDAEIDLRKEENYLVENILNFERKLGDHTIRFTGLYSAQVIERFDQETEARGFVSDALTYHQMNSSSSGVSSDVDFRKSQILSQMGRFNYQFKDRYLVTVTYRRDGYSGFGANAKFGGFPSIALGWVFSDESFFNFTPINFAKLRASYGINGNQAVGEYDNLATLTERNYVIGAAVAPGFINDDLASADLGWEQSATLNVGLDLGFLNNRFQLSTDYYIAQTSGLLLNRQIPTINGDNRVVQNLGEVENRGLEIVAQGYVINNQNFKWRFKGNAAWNKNEIIDLYGDGTDDIANRWFIGYPIRVNYDYEFDGIWQEGDDFENSAQPEAQPGFVKAKDIENSLDEDGNPIVQIDPDNDRVIQGQRDPKVIFGLENTFSYKGFLFYVFLQGVAGVTKENDWKDPSVGSDVRNNWIAQTFWTAGNPINSYHVNHPDANDYGVPYYEDASFMRIKDVTLSYTFKNDLFGKTGLNGVKVYSTIRNLLTFTQYGALDPEFDDQLDTPLQREYVFGLKFSL